MSTGQTSRLPMASVVWCTTEDFVVLLTPALLRETQHLLDVAVVLPVGPGASVASRVIGAATHIPTALGVASALQNGKGNRLLVVRGNSVDLHDQICWNEEGDCFPCFICYNTPIYVWFPTISSSHVFHNDNSMNLAVLASQLATRWNPSIKFNWLLTIPIGSCSL